MRLFPMQHGPAIPWELAETIYKGYAKLHGTQQSLERMAERGGFGWGEVQVIFAELKKRYPDTWRELQAGNTSVNR
jgi:hypothetical protein